MLRAATKLLTHCPQGDLRGQLDIEASGTVLKSAQAHQMWGGRRVFAQTAIILLFP